MDQINLQDFARVIKGNLLFLILHYINITLFQVQTYLIYHKRNKKGSKRKKLVNSENINFCL
jgi:hypothetical protein